MGQTDTTDSKSPSVAGVAQAMMQKEKEVCLRLVLDQNNNYLSKCEPVGRDEAADGYVAGPAPASPAH